MIRSATLHPIGIAAFPILSLYAHNKEQLAIAELWLPLVLSIGVTGLLWLVAGLVLRDPQRSGLIASAAVILLFSFGHVSRSFGPFSPRDEGLLLAIWLLLFALASISFARRRSWAASLRQPLNAASLLLVALPLTSLGHWWLSSGQLDFSVEPPSGSAFDATARPDMFYIVLDGYGATQILKRQYELDNSDFIGWLESKGFFVARKSCANYSQTQLSLASSLNLIYLDGVAHTLGPESRNRKPLRDQIKQNRLFTAVARHGYALYAFDAGYSATQIREVDHFLAGGLRFSDFQNVVLNLTPIPIVLRRFAATDPHEMHRRRILFTLDELPRLARAPGPKLVFAHLITPPPPFVFDEGGGRAVVDGPFGFEDGTHWLKRGTRREYVKGYRAQADFITRRIAEVIESILANSTQPPIIVLQGDHGPGSHLDHESLENTDLDERMFILNAYHLPGDAPDLYAHLTPVNTFRLILSHYLGEPYPLLEDRSFFSTWPRPYDLHEVPCGTRVAGRDDARRR